MQDEAAPNPRHEGAYVRARGQDYREFFKDLHERAKPKWYLEIGTNKGRSLNFVSCSTVAIDPFFQLEAPPQGTKPILLLIQDTSDAAFASDVMKGVNPRFDIAFLDGMHKFEFLLRDLMNAERFMAKDGMIFMHDTSPKRSGMSNRDPLPKVAWTGDVWKLLPIIAEYRPDLKVDHLDCRPTGLTMVRGDWGKNDALTKNYDAIIARYMDMTLEEFGVANYFAAHPHVSAAKFMESLEQR
ncbi:MAG: class I SAM-dependent methyltransferase [Gemmobacter sp.]